MEGNQSYRQEGRERENKAKNWEERKQAKANKNKERKAERREGRENIITNLNLKRNSSRGCRAGEIRNWLPG